jgi:glycosyltransferase involved in cell wall biosynthesis
MKSILLIVDSLSGGGAEIVVIRLALAFQKKGHNVNIIIFKPLIEHALNESINIINLNINKSHGFKGIFFRMKCVKQLKKAITEIEKVSPIDVIISNLPETDRVVNYIIHPNIHYCIHNSFFTSYVSRKSGIKRFFKKFRLRLFYSGKNLIFVSNGVKDEMVSKLGVIPNRFAVINNPFPISSIQLLANQSLNQIKYNYFIHVGRFNKQKRHDRLFSLFKKSGTNCKLVLLGDGSHEQRAYIKQQISLNKLDDDVILMGFKENPFPYIKNAQALLVTSDYEGLPTVIIESLVCGTPVISVDCPSGPREILGEYMSDCLFHLEDADGFAKKILQLSYFKPPIPLSISQKYSDINIVDKYINHCF